MDSQNLIKIFEEYLKYEETLNEMTVTSTTRGTYKPPLRPGIRKWFPENHGAYTISVSEFVDGENNYDSLDGHLGKSKKEISKREKFAKHIRDTDYKTDAPDEGDDEYAQAPYVKYASQIEDINEGKKETKEDLAVWFGTKKKPKGSKQPKGPWVNICRKGKDGKHPPCGRPEADSKGYPKCRAAGVAGKMSDAQKKSACSQKRREEKKNPKSGTGNKPTMVSYKKKKTNESVLIQLIRKSLS